MPKKSLDILKGWAVRGWKPLTSQVHDWFDSFRHKDEMLKISDVDGLAQTLNNLATSAGNSFAQYPLNGDAPYDIPAGYMLEMVIPALGADTQNFSIGTTNGGGELLMATPRLATDDSPILLLVPARTTARRIYLNGVPNNSAFTLFIRKIVPDQGNNAGGAQLDELTAGNSVVSYPLNTDGYYDIPQGYMLEMAIPLLGANSQTFSIGNTNNGGEIAVPLPRLATDETPLFLLLPARTTARRVYLNGVPNNSSFILFIRKISS